MPINPSVINIAFLRWSFAPGLSGILTHNAPNEIAIPSLTYPRLYANNAGNNIPNVIRKPSLKYWLYINRFSNLLDSTTCFEIVSVTWYIRHQK